MNCIYLLLAVAVFVAVESKPDEHRYTGKYVTHVHHYRIPGSGGRGGGGHGGPPGGGHGGPPGGHGGPPGGHGGSKGSKGKTQCQKGLIDGTAGKLKSGADKITSKAAGILGGKKKHTGLLGNLANGAKSALNKVTHGGSQAVSDFFCGFNSVFNKVGKHLHSGNLVGALADGGDTFVTGAQKFFGNIASNAVGAVGSGVNTAAKNYTGK